VDDSLRDGGAHAILQDGYSKHHFSEQIVRAVVQANAESPWCGVLAAMEREVPVPQQAPAPERPKRPGKSSPLGDVVQKIVPYLDGLSDGHSTGRFKLLMDGSLTPETVKYINESTASLIAGASLTKPQEVLFKRFLSNAMTQWYREMALFSKKQATKRFIQSIHSLTHSQSAARHR
ncbi:MAG: hypothetical protein KDD69_13230, partial [Bdellovibrionales bacterium]|nr:hypothetical protein [Bdellovibrionales bacterium]